MLPRRRRFTRRLLCWLERHRLAVRPDHRHNLNQPLLLAATFNCSGLPLNPALALAREGVHDHSNCETQRSLEASRTAGYVTSRSASPKCTSGIPVKSACDGCAVASRRCAPTGCCERHVVGRASTITSDSSRAWVLATAAGSGPTASRMPWPTGDLRVCGVALRPRNGGPSGSSVEWHSGCPRSMLLGMSSGGFGSGEVVVDLACDVAF